MFDGFDKKGAVAKTGSARAIQDILHERGNGGCLAILLANKGDSGAGAEGPTVKVAVSPEKSPGPTNDASRETVFCRLLATTTHDSSIACQTHPAVVSDDFAGNQHAIHLAL